ncbi:hypothetical protein HOC80_04810 [archaeon]|jgi:hypothetical protein|nr:hypothetical protein [archaeon]MBT4417394.1 hypothetical protein [archaeon]
MINEDIEILFAKLPEGSRFREVDNIEMIAEFFTWSGIAWHHLVLCETEEGTVTCHLACKDWKLEYILQRGGYEIDVSNWRGKSLRFREVYNKPSDQHYFIN